MNLQATNSLSEQAFADFFGQETSIIKEAEMKQYGYFLYQNKRVIAFFALFPVDKMSYWLRAFVMKQSAPITLPMTIIQSAEQLTTNYGADQLYIHSKSEAVDDLLTQLGYQQAKKGPGNISEGTWWINNTLIVDKCSTY
ncbi:hypothetical protein F9U64_18440 [Gracilibacillus oryzae]|uniref:N-acetyltransferase domain-containing protein n=1 Tax=Gracilibacillus oryzae TaxID=1672701 RepID=A0A7C8GR36_9BACI|nr:hypothetical protein [Gracilibacillus oryzae]KAB8127176.1 hypothetical protein F9U64_18440 [Gracilibacillus oryzae]